MEYQQMTEEDVINHYVNEPFSQSLNLLIQNIFASTFLLPTSAVRVRFVDFEPYADFDHMKRDIKQGSLLISTLHCDNTIFGNPLINQQFRAIHDLLHYQNDLDFSYQNELIMNYHQNIVFKKLGANQFDLDLLNIETAGQIMQHQKVGEFPENQRLFTYHELKKMGY